MVASAASVGKAAKVEVASVLGEGLGASPAPVMAKASMPKAMRGLFGKKKKM